MSGDSQQQLEMRSGHIDNGRMCFEEFATQFPYCPRSTYKPTWPRRRMIHFNDQCEEPQLRYRLNNLTPRRFEAHLDHFYEPTTMQVWQAASDRGEGSLLTVRHRRTLGGTKVYKSTDFDYRELSSFRWPLEMASRGGNCFGSDLDLDQLWS